MKELMLTCGRVTQVDDEDFFGLLQWTWHSIKGGNEGAQWYAARSIGRAVILLHRFIMNTPSDMITDHIDGNGLNNQKSNLLICSNRRNQLNQHKIRGTVKLPGVTRIRNGKYRARITTPYGSWDLGLFGTPEDAHLAYQHELANQKRITV